MHGQQQVKFPMSKNLKILLIHHFQTTLYYVEDHQPLRRLMYLMSYNLSPSTFYYLTECHRIEQSCSYAKVLNTAHYNLSFHSVLSHKYQSSLNFFKFKFSAISKFIRKQICVLSKQNFLTA